MFNWLKFLKKKNWIEVVTKPLIAVDGRAIVPDDENGKYYRYEVQFTEPVSFSKFVNSMLKLSKKDMNLVKYEKAEQ